MRALLVAAALLLLAVAVAPPASAAPNCYGTPPPRPFTGVCFNDPNCIGPDGTPGVGTYENGRRTGCTYW